MARLFIILVLLALSGSYACAETGTDIGDLLSLTKQHGQQFHNRFKALERADRDGQYRIDLALYNLRQARTANAKTYHRLDYVEQRATHIKHMAREIIGMLQDNDEFLKVAKQARKNFRLYVTSDQVVGMRVLLNMVMNAESENGSATDALDQVLTLTLAALVSPPQVMSEPELSLTNDCRNRLTQSLKKFRKEIVYLDQQLQVI